MKCVYFTIYHWMSYCLFITVFPGGGGILSFVPEYQGHPDYDSLVLALRKQLFALPRQLITHTVLSEKNWYVLICRFGLKGLGKILAEFNCHCINAVHLSVCLPLLALISTIICQALLESDIQNQMRTPTKLWCHL